MNKWAEKRLDEVIKVNPTVKLKKGESYPFIDMDKVSSTNKFVSNIETKVYDGQSSSKFENGDTVFARITPCLQNRKIAKVKLNNGEKAFGSTEFYVFREIKDITDKDFVYYLISSDLVVLPAINSMTGASGRQRADRRFIEQLNIKLPSIPTQQKIANILSAYDELIENNNRRIELLEKAAENLYKEWFVRFRFPDYKETKFEKGMPHGWKIGKLGDAVNVTSSKRVYLSDYVEYGVPFYRSKEVIQLSNGKAISELLYISEEKYLEFKNKYGVPKKNDILLTSVGTIGIPLLVSDNKPFYFKDGNLTWIQSSSSTEVAIYLYFWIKSDIGKQQLLSSTIGTSQSALTIEKLKNIKIVVPTDDIISEFSNFTSDIMEKINNLQTQNQNLIKQRDLLLPRLMSGKLEV